MTFPQTQFRHTRWQDRLQAVLDDSLKSGSLGCVLGLDIPGRERLVLTSGHKNIEGDTSVSRRDLFQVGSITKMLTAALVLKLVKEERISLHDDVRDFVPEIPGAGKIPLYSLLNHTSGLGNASAVLDPIRRLVDYPLDFKQRMLLAEMRGHNGRPGEKYEYNNVGYWIIAKLVETLAGEPYEDCFRRSILVPLKLENTYAATNENLSALPLERMARGYHIDERSTEPVETTNTYSLSEAGAAGNLVSNVDDMLDWLSAITDAESPLDLSLDDFWQYQTRCDDGYSLASDSYGMGMICFKFGGLECWGHGGAMCGFMSLSMVDQGSGIRLCMLSNKITRFGPTWLDQQKIGFFYAVLAVRMVIEALGLP